MTAPLFYVSPEALAAATAEGADPVVTLDAEASRHAAGSLRLSAGDQVLVADGVGTGFTGEITEAASRAVTIRLGEQLTDSTAATRHTRVQLVQALAKGDRDLLAVQTCVELGIDRVIPWESERAIVRWKADKAAKMTAKWQTSIRAAAQQARRVTIPQLGEPVTGTQVADLTATPDTDQPAETHLMLVAHQDAEISIRDAVRAAQDTAGAGGLDTVTVVVGPEGGISPQEIDALTKAGAVPVLIGTNILRASTAGPAALTLVNEYLGRW